jgi:hypothetical protein
MKVDKQTILVLIIAIILVLILFLFAILIFTNKKTTATNPVNTTISITPPINYNLKDQQKLLNEVTVRTPLSAGDSLVRKNLIASIGGKSGNLLLTSNVVLSYIASADVFQGEILIPDADTAKNETVKWLTSQGLSKEGVCKLPLMFFITPDAVSGFQATKKEFSPLPPGC